MAHDNVRALREFYRLFYNEKRFAEGAALLTEGFVNHHPGAGSPGRQGMIDDFFRLAASKFPDMHIEPIRMVADGELVWALGHATGLGGSGGLCVDIWRFEGGAIAEHWDTFRALSPDEDPRALLARL